MVIQRFFRGADLGGMWRLLFKPSGKGNKFPSRAEDIGLSRDNPIAEVWRVRAKTIRSPAPLLEDPRSPELERLLTEDPYVVPPKTKKEEGKKTRAKNLAIREKVSDAPTGSYQSSASESSADEEVEEEESEVRSSQGGKRLASEDAEEVAPPQMFKRLRKAHTAPAGHTSAPMEPISSGSSEDVRRPREHRAAERAQRDLPGEDDSDDGVPRASLARSSSETATDPPPTQDEPGEATSHSAHPAPNAGGGTEVLMAEVNSLSAEENTKDQGRKTSSGQEELVLERPASLAPTTLESQGRQGTPPAPSIGDGARRTPTPMLGLEGAELSRRQQEVEAALSSSSILPDHRAMLGTALTQFRSSETGILELFLGLTKGLEASTSSFASNLKELEDLKRKLAQSKEDSLRLQERVEKAQAAKKDLADLRAELEKARYEAE